MIREERRVRRHHDNDRPPVFRISRIFRYLLSHWHARDTQILPHSVIALDQNTDRVATVFGGESARRSPDAAFEVVANHPGAAADIALGDEAGLRGIERVEGVLGFHVEAVDVVQPAIVGFRDNGQRPGVLASEAIHLDLGHRRSPREVKEGCAAARRCIQIMSA